MNHIEDTRNATYLKRGQLMFQMVEELKGILLEAANEMKPSFHPNRWDTHVVCFAES